MSEIDEIVLRHDKRGISKLKKYMGKDNYLKTAEFVLGNFGTVLIATGFIVNGFPETDGPPGAVLLARALRDIGFSVNIVSDSGCLTLLREAFGDEFQLIDFPVADSRVSKSFAISVLEKYQPTLLISIERCGFTRENLYKNMRGVDISMHTAKIDHLFILHPATIGIGDGGNEIGMGVVYEEIKLIPELVQDPAATSTTKLLLASVSNWGAYGLVTALSEMVNRNLLPSSEKMWGLIERVVDSGGVDGISGRQIKLVDGFDYDIDGEIINSLHEYLKERLL